MIYGTGLLPDDPEVEPPCARFGDGNKVLSISEIVNELKQPGRTKSRDIFGPEWIQSQGRTNGCTGFAAAGCLERARVRHGHKPVKLSGAGVWTQINGGRNVGTHLHDAIRVMQTVGVPPQELVTNLTAVQKRAIPQAAWEAAGRFTVAKGEVTYATTEEELATGLLMGWTAGIALQANGTPGTPYWQLDGDGIIKSGNGSGNHAVGLDDVEIAKSGGVKFDKFGSWGTKYGQGGRAYVTWNRHLSRPVRTTRFYLIRATSDDPKASNPPVAR